jgi:acyl transferase domain-containing protein/thioesterase domain-containing protein/acyl carrier protein
MNARVGCPAASLRERLAGQSEPERASALLSLIRAEVAAVVGEKTPRLINVESPWRRLGIYREFATELRGRLAAAVGLQIPATVFFDHPTPAALLDYLRAELLGERIALTPPAPERARAGDEPIAIVGMACRFPGGVRSPDQLWQFVAGGGDAISAFPKSRGWDLDALQHPDAERSGSTYVRGGGFLPDADQFDPGFFGISPREAAALDPQQRLLLETSWEALEHAGIDPFSLKGSRTGVYVGIAYRDYGPNWHEPPKGYAGQLLTGALTSVASGRVSYTLGLEGPAITVDTACSSSLVALHLGVQALRAGECSLALTGGATVMATPGLLLEFSCKRGLAPDGRCKSFSADADGTGWGEGAGMLVVERLSDARRNGHRVLALVRGSALNQDGASNGLTAPRGPSQRKVIRQALANAGLSPHEVDAVEAHGTGTTLGDPIEAQALISTYGQGRSHGPPLWLGSLKSNIGHCQAAAAVGGVIKMVMAIRHGILPRTLHITEPSPRVDWSAGAVSVLTEDQPWPQTGHPRRAGVSSFGVSGTNGHVILEQALPTELTTRSDQTVNTVLPWVVSARSAAALRGQADRLRAHLEIHPELQPVDVGYSLAAKTPFEHRGVLIATDREEFLHGVTALASEATAPGLIRGTVRADAKVAFLFSGQGSQRPGMGRELYAAFPPFARAWDEVCTRFDDHLGRSLQDVMWAPEGSFDAELLDQTAYTQPALFTLQVALYRLLERCGVIPDVLLGHSVGELAAAHVAGALSLDDACALVAARGQGMQACRSGGAMVAIQAGEDEVRCSLDGPEGRAEVALINGATATVIAGDEDAVLTVAARWEAKGRKTKRLRVSHAFHSFHMNPMLDRFQRTAESLCFRRPTIPIVSTLTGRVATAGELCSPEYWVRHVREPVRFFDGMRTLEAEDVTAFFELGPDATLTTIGRECLTEERPLLVPALRAGRSEPHSLTTALAELHVRGLPVDWRGFFDGRGARRIELPTYAFQRQRYWLDAPRLIADRVPLQADAAGWRYRVAWKPVVVPARSLTGTWLVVAGCSNADYELAALLTAVLVSQGVRVVPVALDDAVLDRDQLITKLEKVLADGATVDGVLSLLALDETPQVGHPAMTKGVIRTVALAQAWAEAGVDAPLWCATRGAVSVGDSDRLCSPAQAMVWGLGRTVGLEHPRRWGGLIDLPEVLDEPALRRACAALAGLAGEDQLAVRDGGVFLRRIVRGDPVQSQPRTWRPRGSVLITGGTGAVGAHAARWLARNGAEHLILVSRRGLNASGAVELRDELTMLGTQVTVAACDVADKKSLAGLLSSLPTEHALTAVVHAAGISGRFAALTEVDAAEFAEVVSAKVAGAIHLDLLLEGHPLDAFVLISSIAGVWGSGGQVAYAAGNAFLDALAHQRRARGLVATSVACGPWAEGGMAADPTISTHLLQRGLPTMAPQVTTVALWQAVAAGDTASIVADVDWPRFLPTFTAARVSHLFEDMSEAGGAASPTDVDLDENVWRPRLAGASESERGQILLQLVRAEAAEILGHATPMDIDAERQFLDLGFDSLAAVELRTRLAQATGLTLPATVVFDQPTATALARYLGTQLAGDAVPAHVEHNRAPGGELETVRFLYRRACALDMFDAGLDVLKAAARLRPVFHSAAELGNAVELVQLAAGPASPALVCCPPYVAPCGPHNYARLALSLQQLRDVYSLTHPGFGNGEPVPATAELVVAMQAEAVRRRLGNTAFAMVGYSSGGWFAHAITAHLETLGIFPTAVILLDSLALRDDAWDQVRPPLKTMALNDQAFALMTADQLTAMAAYFRLFENWEPATITTPVLLLRATECVPEWAGEPISDEYWRASWDLSHEILDVRGDHLSLMKEDVASTAFTLHRWLEDQERSSRIAAYALSPSLSTGRDSHAIPMPRVPVWLTSTQLRARSDHGREEVVDDRGRAR